MDYHDFLTTKRRLPPSSGLHCTPGDLHPSLFDFQAHIVAWAVRRGRAAIWADTGLGKAQPVDEPVLTPSGWLPIGDLAVGDERRFAMPSLFDLDDAPERAAS